MHAVWSFFIRKNNVSYLLIVALVVFGLFSLITLPRESSPEVTVPIGVVSVSLSGASALDIETLITNAIEERLRNNLDNVKNLTSTSREGFSSVVVEFDARADIDASMQKLKDEIDNVKSDLPDGATDPTVTQVDLNSDPILTFAVSGNLPQRAFFERAEELETDIEGIEGVSDVSVSGKQDRQVHVIVNKESLSTFGLTIAEVISSISATNNTLPAGGIIVDDIAYNVQFEGGIDDPQEIADIAILRAGGKPIYVRDIAEVIDGFEEPTSISRASIAGEPSRRSLFFNVFKQSGGDITKITTAVNERLEARQAPGEPLFGLETLVMFDMGAFLLKDLQNLMLSGLQTVLLVMVILFLTIGWREALIAGSAIPLSFLIAFIGLSASGNTLNFISLFSLILAVGILVDSAIVMVEGIHTRMKQRMDKREAAFATIKEFHWPLTSGTMTTIAVFAPLFLISGIVGEFIKAIPFTIIFVLLASLLVALGLIPLIASMLMRRRVTSRGEARQEKYAAQLQAWYSGVLRTFLQTRRYKITFVVGLVAAFVVAIALPITGLVKVIFFDQGDADFVIVEIELPQGTTLSQTDIEARRVEEILYTEPDIDAFTVTSGAGSAFGSRSAGSKFASAFLLLSDANERQRTSLEIIDSLREKVSIIETSEVRVNQPSNGPPVGTPIVIKFIGKDLEALNRTAERAANLLAEIPGTADTTSSTKDDHIEFVLTVDKAKAAELGLNSQTISQTLRASINGIKATTVNTIDDDIDVIVKLNLNAAYQTPHDTNRATIDAVRGLELQTPEGSILLGSVLDTNVGNGNAVIRHEDGVRIATAGSEVASGGNVRQITQAFRDRLNELALPAGVEVAFGGENEETNQSFREMGVAFVIGVVVMFAILMLQFNSLRHAVYTLSVIPTALIGIFFGLLITGKALSFPSLMGLIALSGIVVNNSIILIDTINNVRRRNPEKAIQDIVIEGATSRLRPVLLTTVTTVIGISPLIFASELWAPLAFSIIFGLSFTVVITLLMIPMLYHRRPGKIQDDTATHELERVQKSHARGNTSV